MPTLISRLFSIAVLAMSATSSLAEVVLSPNLPPPSRAQRTELANHYLEELESIYHQIPTLSPEQAAWLEAEYDEEIARADNHFTNRAIKAMRSTEYALRETKPEMAELLENLKRLGSNDSLPITEEMARWTSLAAQLVDVSMWQALKKLSDEGIVDMSKWPYKELYAANYTLQAQAILRFIVVQYFNGALPK